MNYIKNTVKDIKFITEKTIISKNYLIAGIADLIVDLGDNNLLVFDYKTTRKLSQSRYIYVMHH